VEYRFEEIFMSDSISLAVGDYFAFARNSNDETQVFLRIDDGQVERWPQAAVICIPMDLWLVMHSAGVPSFELAKMTDQELQARAVLDVEGRMQQLYEASSKSDRISASGIRLADFGSISSPREIQVERHLEHLKAKRQVQLDILKRSAEHRNHGKSAGFK
jgi:hypothetical protein